MPNRYQVAFLLTFGLGLVGLFTLSHLIQQALFKRGLSPIDLLLTGLPRNVSADNAPTSYSFLDPVAVLLDMASKHDVNALFTPNNIAVAGAVGAIVITALYFALGGSSKSKARPAVLDPGNWKEFELVQKVPISHNTAVYRFGLPDPQDVLGLPIGQHISLSAEIAGKEVMRSYTPTTNDATKGHFDLVIKTYDMGNISKHVAQMKIGQKIRVKGPKGQFNYSPGLVRHLGMLAGGTGITPMYQIIQAISRNPADKTKVSLIYANVAPEDILLKDELDAMAASRPDQIKIFHVLNKPPAGWTGGEGFVSKDHIQIHLPPTADDIKILLCGPPPMNNAMKKHLADLGYPAPRTISKLPDQVFIF
jgi:cytochrome-b5 reductase